MLDQLGGVEGSVPSYPPYNIERTEHPRFRDAFVLVGRDEQRLIPPACRWSRVHGRVRRLLEKIPRFVTFVLLVNGAGPSHATCLNINALQPDEEVDLIKRRLARR